MMMMDNTAIDSASDHSSHASSGSPAVAIKQSPSPPTNNNNIPNHHHHHLHSPRQASPLGPPMSMAHPLSPPPVSSASLARSMALGHLPPPGLGLLNSLGVLHNPLDLMAHHGPPRSYNSPPPISTSDPTANECKLVDYRGQKVAAFIIAGDTMLCLPQAFELFLKHLVGGLHTVYTKLKRLDIVPLVCNVEQVRILRGLGAIQPGVNRCKLLSCKDFDTLYKDCTTASSRPGRPPKRAPVGLSLAASHLQHQQMKKQRMDNGDYPYENGHMGDMGRLEKSPLLANGYNHPPHLSHMQFMQLPHPAAAHSALLSPAMPHNLSRHDGSIIKNQGMPAMEAIARSGIWENCRAAYEDIVKHLERLREERGDPDRPLPLEQKPRDLSSISPRNGSPTTDHSPVLNLSKSGGGSAGSLGDNDHSGSEADGPDVPPSPRSPRSAVEDEDDNISEPEDEDEKDQDLDDVDLPLPTVDHHQQAALNYSTLASSVAIGANPEAGVSSTETLLRNIQGLLKVAADNARQQERQINYEKAELKMDVLRQRDEKDNLERQLQEEQKLRGFENEDRFVGFDLPATKEALKMLAHFHAVPLVMKFKTPDVFATLKNYLKKCQLGAPPKSTQTNGAPAAPPAWFPTNPAARKPPTDLVIEQMMKMPGCQPYKIQLQAMRNDETDRTEHKFAAEPWNTVVHGDYWVNNIMLKPRVNLAPRVKMLDFQFLEYGSFGLDVVFFLLSSIKNDILLQHLDDLIKFYYEELMCILSQRGVVDLKLTYEDYLSELKRCAKSLGIEHLIFFSCIIFGPKAGADVSLGEIKMLDYLKKVAENMTEDHKEKLELILKLAGQRGWI